ncbi:MAG: APC family permease, partial [Acidimicrobiales bacterium]
SGGGSSISFVQAAQRVVWGGRWLGWLMLGAAVISNLALYVGYLASGARPAFMMSRDRLLPRIMYKTHKKYGTPAVTIVLMACVNAVLVRWGFDTLIVIDVFMIMCSYSMIFIAGCVLRYTEPDLERPYRVPLPNWGVVIMCIAPILLAIYELFANGMQDFAGGFIAVMSGPIVFTIYKARRHGVLQDDVIAEENAEIAVMRSATEAPLSPQPLAVEGGIDA